MVLSTQGARFSEIEYLAAENILKDFDPEHFNENDHFSPPLNNQIFDAAFQGSLVRKPHFTNCRFTGTQFDGNDAVASSMVACDFISVVFRDACLNYSDLSDSKFDTVLLDNCGCSNINFSNVSISKSQITGCDFIRSFFCDTKIDATSFIHCSFEESEFKNAEFFDVDLTQTGFDYAILDTASFTRTTLPFWGVLRSFGGLNALSRRSKDVQIKYSSNSRAISIPEFFSKLEALQAYFYRKKQYFVLANVSIFLGDQKSALSYILEGLRENIQNRNFRTIRHLCELASRNRFFQKKQLLQLYDLLISEDATSDMNHHEYQLYLAEIREIKHLLVENPYGSPRMTISIQTAMPCDDYSSLAVLLRFIDKSLQYYMPQCIYYISIYRNSPPLLEISVCEVLTELFPYLIAIAAIIYGTGNKSVKLLQEICTANGIRLDNQEKKMHLKAAQEQETLKTEHMKLENEMLQVEIAKKKLDLKEKQQAAVQQTSPHTEESKIPDLSPELKRQILSIKFTIQSDTPDFIAPRQGVLMDDEK